MPGYARRCSSIQGKADLSLEEEELLRNDILIAESWLLRNNDRTIASWLEALGWAAAGLERDKARYRKNSENKPLSQSNAQGVVISRTLYESVDGRALSEIMRVVYGSWVV